MPLAGSFAFRLGTAFAVVAIISAGIAALVVNAAFAARFDRYLVQQHAQVTQITTAAGRAYARNGKWDLHALRPDGIRIGGSVRHQRTLAEATRITRVLSVMSALNL